MLHLHHQESISQHKCIILICLMMIFCSFQMEKKGGGVSKVDVANIHHHQSLVGFMNEKKTASPQQKLASSKTHHS